MYRNKAALTPLKFNSFMSSWPNFKRFINEYGIGQFFHILTMMKNFSVLQTVNFNGYILSLLIAEGPNILPKVASHFIIMSGDDINLGVKMSIEKKAVMIGCYTPRICEILECESFKNADDLRPE